MAEPPPTAAPAAATQEARRPMQGSRSANDISSMEADPPQGAGGLSQTAGGTTRRVDPTLLFKKRLSMTGGLFFKSNVDFLAHLDCAYPVVNEQHGNPKD